MGINEKIDALKKKTREYEDELKDLIESDTFKISTNTAFLQNIKLQEKFEGFGFFPDWLKLKHQQMWDKQTDGDVEITFKIKIQKEKGIKMRCVV